MTETSEKDPRLVDAELIKLAAETRKLEVEALTLEEDKKIKAAEAEQRYYHALSAKYGAESMRIQTEATQRQEKLALVTDHHARIYRFDGPVYANHPAYGDQVGDCLHQLAIWDRLDPTCDMTVVFTSPGGDVIAGMALFDQVSAYSLRPWDNSDRPKGTHKTTGIIRGEAASMAGILIQAFDERVQGPEATLMVHQVSSWTSGSLGDLKDHMDHLEKLTERVGNIFVRRSGGKISPEGFDKLWARKASYLDSDESLRFGLVDRIG